MKKKAVAHQNKRRRHIGRRTLMTIAFLLASSGIIRLGGLGIATADDVSHLLMGTSAATEPLPTCSDETDIEIVLSALRKREANLVSKETALRARLTALKTTDQKVSEKIELLKDAEAQLSATLATAKTAASDDINQLTILYENMKPKQAIPMFEAMEADFAAGFLSRMKPEVASQIMAGLDPQKAYAISVVVAGRHSKTPNE